MKALLSFTFIGIYLYATYGAFLVSARPDSPNPSIVAQNKTPPGNLTARQRNFSQHHPKNKTTLIKLNMAASKATPTKPDAATS
jgi:hypothetical protein